jgi:regulatory protein
MDESRPAFEYALRTLTRRDHSEVELRRKLRDKGFSDQVVDNVVSRLTDLKYLDDRRYARSWAETALRNGRGYGPRLRMELKRRGIAVGLIAETLAELGESYAEADTLAAILARKFTGFHMDTATDKEKRRVVSYLQRRGFSLGTIFTGLHNSTSHEYEE